MAETEDLILSSESQSEPRELWEIVTRGELHLLTEEDDLSPYLPLLSRIALAHELRPQEGGPFEHLTRLIQKYPEANRCRHYAQLDWPALLRPIRHELSAAASDPANRSSQAQQSMNSSIAHPLPRAHSPSKDSQSVANTSETGGAGKDMDVSTESGHEAAAPKVPPGGHEVVAEFERGEAERRMQLLLVELAALVRKDASRPKESLLLSKAAMQEELKAMLPLAFRRCRRLLGLAPLLQVLRWVDDHYVLLASLLFNTPGIVAGTIGVVVAEAAKAGESGKETRGGAAGGQGAGGGGTGAHPDRWWPGALMLVARLSRGCAFKVRAAAMEAGVLPETVVEVTIRLLNDPVPFFLGCTQGHEVLWEHLHGALSGDAPPESPALRLRQSMAEVLQQATAERSEAAMEVEGAGGGGPGGEGQEQDLKLLGVSNAGSLGLSGLLRLYCALIALAGMQLTLPEVLGRSVLPSHGETAPAKGGLLSIMCGVEGRPLPHQARQLALCALVLWPRLKSVIPGHVVAASIRAMWTAIASHPQAAHAQAEGGGAGAAAGGEGGEPTPEGGGVEAGAGDGKGGGGAGDGAKGGQLGDIGEVYLLLSLFVTRELSAVGEHVRTITALTTHVQGEALTKLADIIGEGTDVRELARAVLRGGGEGGGGGSLMPGRFQCAHTLLRDYKLVNSNDDAARFSKWLLGAMTSATLPVAGQLAQLLEEAAAQCTVERSKVQPLPLEALREMLARGGGRGPPFGPTPLLAALYLLARRAASVAKKVEAGGRRRQMKRLHELGRAVDDKGLLDSAHESLATMLPLRLMLEEAEQPQYEGLYPQLLEHAVAQYPYLFATIHLEMPVPPSAGLGRDGRAEVGEEAGRVAMRSGPLEVAVAPATVRDVFADFHSDVAAAILTLDALCRLDEAEVDKYGGSLLYTLLPRLVTLQDRRATALFADLWERLFRRHPAPVAAKTVHALLHKPGLAHPRGSVEEGGAWLQWGWGEAAVPGGGAEELILLHDSLMRDVLGVLAAAEPAAEDPALLRIILKTLSLYQTGSEALLVAQAEVGKAGKQSTEEKAVEEQLATLLLTQQSCLLQLLLELALHTLPAAPNLPSPTHAAQRRSTLCQYIHQMFIRQPLLVKLVHFQRYHPRLIAVLVEEVPSMHTSVQFLPELLSTADVPTRGFAILLASEVARKYPLQQTEGIVNVALQRMREAVDSDSSELLRMTLPILPVVAAAFPRTGIANSVSVSEQAVELLARVRREVSPRARGQSKKGEEAGGGEGLEEVVEAAFQGVMERVLLLEGVAT